MRRALREHSRDVAAIGGLVLAGLFSLFVILASQGANLPGWVPLLGSDRFELKAEFSSAQAVTPGQGQSVDISGIKVGEVTGVTLEDGHAVVSMKVDNKYAPLIHSNASMLLRPKTGLNDMVVEVDPGTTSSPRMKEGSTVPLASTQPQVNPDEILASLDADTQAFLKLLLGNGAEALDPAKGRDVKLSNALRRLEPFSRDIARITGSLAVRRENIRRAIHNFSLLSQQLGEKDQDVTAFVDSSNAALAAFAHQEASIRGALRELPATLRETKGALGSANSFALNATPALRDLIPGAAATKPALIALRGLFQATTAPIRDQIRPFTTEVASPVHHIRDTSVGLGFAVPGLRTGFSRLNLGLNGLTYDPPGDQVSTAFYIPWLNHNLNNLALLQDAHGPLARGMVMVSCNTARLAESTAFTNRAFLLTLAELTGFPSTAKIDSLGGC
jgi:phospholipid/cholesterol/gamma-HCH transport system substrate-binding protein